MLQNLKRDSTWQAHLQAMADAMFFTPTPPGNWFCCETLTHLDGVAPRSHERLQVGHRGGRQVQRAPQLQQRREQAAVQRGRQRARRRGLQVRRQRRQRGCVFQVDVSGLGSADSVSL